jgi:hypothetical protein
MGYKRKTGVTVEEGRQEGLEEGIRKRLEEERQEVLEEGRRKREGRGCGVSVRGLDEMKMV